MSELKIVVFNRVANLRLAFNSVHEKYGMAECTIPWNEVTASGDKIFIPFEDDYIGIDKADFSKPDGSKYESGPLLLEAIKKY